ncbi:MAG: transglycosylase SLT domain-containing protein [Burkholderiales bacterium]|nr:transglycosylase SLT domain-containing protein [Burkholderiales bacterium]
MNALKRACAARRIAILLLATLFHAGEARPGPQVYEPLSASTRHALQRAVSDQAVEGSSFQSREQARSWILAMSPRLRTKLPDSVVRIDFLRTVHYEATRAGLDPQLVLAVIQVESNFRKYAVSTAGARGYMQVMPFWLDLIGTPEHNLFHLRTNLRYGCLILRHYLDIERGNLTRALGRYNGSLGKLWYPSLVQTAWKNAWQYDESVIPASANVKNGGGRADATFRPDAAVTAAALRR